ncbi:hypothetical protein EDD90_3125 [Streptomyces sp. Ag109_O5-1]|uniref:hypothetical protein n=1 Tax=Streptomyces TaxID=1883 RepID=UPI000F4E4DEF|nr:MULTISPECIES: hypothetical protein [Streptomyces]RPE40096.1 hypothetical protein EDD90_3125 [Streptomyces sp. Ag109_O5-1]
MDDEARTRLFSSFVTDLLAEERARKNSFEQRGVTVISTAGTLVGIVTGLVALAPWDGHGAFDGAAQRLLVAALCLLSLAALVGLAVNLPALLPYADADALDDPRLRGGASFGLQEEIRQKVATTQELRRLNRTRARALLTALAFEVLALALMTVSVALELRGVR